MKKYCIKCKEDVEYVVREEEIELLLKGTNVKYIGKAAYCANCGEYIFVDEITDYNIDKAREEYFKSIGGTR